MEVRNRQHNLGFGNLTVKASAPHNNTLTVQEIKRFAETEGFAMGRTKETAKGTVFNLLDAGKGIPAKTQKFIAKKLRENFTGLTIVYTKLGNRKTNGVFSRMSDSISK